MKEKMPRRRSDLNISELPDELLVMDLATKEVHCLNQDAGLVFGACDGKQDQQEVANLLRANTGSEEGDDLLIGILAALESKGLLDQARTYDRRTFMQRSGIAAAAAAVLIDSVVTPASAAQLSCNNRRRRTCSR